MKSKFLKILFQVISGTIAVAAVLGAWAVGLIFSNEKAVYPHILIAICIVILVCAILTNVIGTKRFLNKFNNAKVEEIRNLGEKIKADIESDYSLAEKKVKRGIACSYVYMCLILIVLLLLPFSVGLLNSGMEVSIIAAIIDVFFVWGITDHFFIYNDGEQFITDLEISEKDFPLLNTLVKETAISCGCNKKVKMYFCGDNISVSEHKNVIAIHIGYLEFAYLTAEELRSVLLHEFAHVVNLDSRRGAKFAKEEQRWNFESENPIIYGSKLLLTSLPATNIYFNINFYRLFASRYQEILADEKVGKLGNAQEYANALAKTSMLAKFRSTPCRELEYDYYEPEQAPMRFAELSFETFEKYLEKYADFWKRQLSLELPARIDSHPTFKQRFKATGCENYDIFTKESDAEYAAEQKKFLQINEKYVCDGEKENYPKMRENEYLRPKRIMEEYDEAIKSGKELTDSELINAMDAFYRIDDDKTLQICDKLLASHPSLPNVNMVKGLILRNRMDDRCIQCFKTACDSPNFTQDAIDKIGEYALISGNQELLDEYRKNYTSIMQNSIDKQKETDIDRRTVFSECGLSEEFKKQLTQNIVKLTENRVTQIYVAKYPDKINGVHYCVIPVFEKNLEYYIYSNYMDSINNFLIALDKDFSLFIDSASVGKTIKKTKDTLIYNKNFQ